MRKFVFLLLAVVLLAAIGYRFYTRNSAEPDLRQNLSDSPGLVSSMPPAAEPLAGGIASTSVYTITMTDAGYEPPALSIKRGDSVRFVNQSNGQFWPASGKHPTHEICPQFDPKRALPKGESYEVKFDEVKTCSFHDHLHPALRGSITVQ